MCNNKLRIQRPSESREEGQFKVKCPSSEWNTLALMIPAMVDKQPFGHFLTNLKNAMYRDVFGHVPTQKTSVVKQTSENEVAVL